MDTERLNKILAVFEGERGGLISILQRVQEEFGYGTACHVLGARDILETAEKCLGIKTGQTTSDYKYSLERVACLGSCALAPVVLVDNEVHSRMTVRKVKKILTEDLDDTETQT
jgi:NADH:ubiquinone oxidoreductase subunit E